MLKTLSHQLIFRSGIIQFCVRIGFISILSNLALRTGRFFDNGSKYTVLCIGRPIFDEEIEALAENGCRINYLVIPKAVFIAVCRCFIPQLIGEHVNYHSTGKYNREKLLYRRFLDKFFVQLLKRHRFDAVLSANYVYSWQQEIASLCEERDMPFIVLHKEGITSKKDYFRLVEKYTNKKFIGTKLMVYNYNMKEALLEYGVRGLNDENIDVVGVPRFDKYSSVNQSGEGVVFFSFFIEDKLGHVNVDEDGFKLLVKKAKTFHSEIMRYAANHPNVTVVIKTKENLRYLNYVQQIADADGFGKLKNLNITNVGKPYDLINDAAVVIGYNSSVLVEGVIANRLIIIPDFEGELIDSFFVGYPDIVHIVKTADDLEKVTRMNRPSTAHDDQKEKFLKNSIHMNDGKASERAEISIIDCVHSNT